MLIWYFLNVVFACWSRNKQDTSVDDIQQPTKAISRLVHQLYVSYDVGVAVGCSIKRIFSRPRTPVTQQRAVKKSKPPTKKPKKFNVNNVFSDLPAGVKTEKDLSDDILTCKSMGGNGEPCSYDIAENGSCQEKQYWSDNGWTEYQVSIVQG